MTFVAGEAGHAVLGAAEKSAEELIEVGQEEAVECQEVILREGSWLLTIASTFRRWPACSSSRGPRHRRRGS